MISRSVERPRANARPRVVVALSGGVDSAVAAALLVAEGYDVRAMSLRLWESSREDGRVCSDFQDAERVAAHLGIDHEVVDRRGDFRERVVTPFVTEYASGRTPNPCVACNSEFKLGWLLDRALADGADFVATGHYARVERTEPAVLLRRGADAARDQSYFLFALAREQLERTMFPLGELTKAAVREKARALRLPVADKPDSQDLCFGRPAQLVSELGARGRAGDIADSAGNVLGRHDGIEHFTIGQRRGLGISAPRPMYVETLDPERARVTISFERPRANELVAADWRWTRDPPAADERILAQVRHHGIQVEAFVEAPDGLGRRRVRLERPLVAVTPGQAIVLYRGDEVVGGGWIDSAEPLH